MRCMRRRFWRHYGHQGIRRFIQSPFIRVQLVGGQYHFLQCVMVILQRCFRLLNLFSQLMNLQIKVLPAKLNVFRLAFFKRVRQLDSSSASRGRRSWWAGLLPLRQAEPVAQGGQ